MFFICNSSFVACSLLTTFDTITKKERDVVRFVLELIPCYDERTGRLRMTHDAHVLAQIHLAELRILAARHSYIHEGSLEDPAQARALLGVIVLPIVKHLSHEEYDHLLDTMLEVDVMLSYPIDLLEDLVTMWEVTNRLSMLEWCTHPVEGVDVYEYGVQVPGGFRLEDILAPLPYPALEHFHTPMLALPENEFEDSGIIDPKTTQSQGGQVERKAELERNMSHNLPSTTSAKSLPRSECSKELELLASQKSKPRPFILANLFSRRKKTTSYRDSESDRNSVADSWCSDSYFDIDDILKHEVRLLAENEFKCHIESGEFDCPCETGDPCYIHLDERPADHGVGIRVSTRKQAARRLRSMLKF